MPGITGITVCDPGIISDNSAIPKALIFPPKPVTYVPGYQAVVRKRIGDTAKAVRNNAVFDTSVFYTME